MSRKFTNKLVIPALLGLMFAVPSQAAISLLAIGSIAAGGSDLSSQTAGPLESGVAGNILGGLGSGLAYAGGNTFYATPDRGPNATSYTNGGLVDNTTSYITRFQTLNMNLVANAGPGLPYVLTPTLTATTLFSSPTALTYGNVLGSGTPALNAVNNTNYFSGRSDNFGTGVSTNPNHGRFDPEGVRVSNDGQSVFVSDEYGPYVYQFNVATGQRVRSFTLPANLAIANLSPVETTEISGNTTGRTTNKGMEGLAISPDGTTLYGIMQAPLRQDTNKVVRIVKIDIASGNVSQYAYQLTDGSGVSEILAINDHEFLVLERDGKGLGDGSNAAVKKLYKIDLNGAAEVSALSGNLSASAVSKTLFLDIVAALTANGISTANIPAKMEAIAFGQDIVVGGQIKHTLYLANDNDFLASAGANNFYVFGVDGGATGNQLIGDNGFTASFTPQAVSAVPLPGALLLMLTGLTGFGLFGRRRKSA